MRTGFDLVEEEENDLKNRVLVVIKLLAEQAIKTSARFVGLCGRTVVTPMDMRMALIYEAHVFFKRDDLEAKFIEAETFELDEDDDEADLVVDDDELYSTEFFGKTSDDRIFHAQMIGFTKNWPNWNPTDPIEQLLQTSINKV